MPLLSPIKNSAGPKEAPLEEMPLLSLTDVPASVEEIVELSISLRESITDEALLSELNNNNNNVRTSSSTSDVKCSNFLVCRTRRLETDGDINRNRGMVLFNSWTCA